MLSLALLFLVGSALALPADVSSTARASIDAQFKAAGKLYFGAGTDRQWLEDGKTPALLKRYFGAVTPMNK